MRLKKVHLIGTFGFVVALVALEAACSRTGNPTTEAMGPAPTTAPSAQNPTPESAALQITKAPTVAPAPAAKKSIRKAAPKTTAAEANPSEAKATPPTPVTPQTAVAPIPEPQPKSATFAAGTALRVRTTSRISTESHKTGDTFAASLEEPLASEDWVVAPKGAMVEGRILNADKGGRVKGTAQLEIALDRLQTADGRSISLSTKSVTVEAKSTEGKDAAKIAIGTGVGAVIGAIAGGKKGAAIGAATGAGAGTATVLATRGDAAEIAAESLLSFELSSPLTISENR